MGTSHEFHLMQLADSFFPSGSFGLSGGLESLVRSGRVKDKKTVLQFIRQQLHFQLAPCECPTLLIVMDAAAKDDIDAAVDADNLYHSMRLVSEARVASTRSGRQILNCITRIAPTRFAKKFQARIRSGRSAGSHPASLAVAAHSLAIPNESALRVMLYSFSASMVASAVRLGIIEHLEAQAILSKLAQETCTLEAKIKTDELWQLCPLVDILQMQHQRDELRMFIT